MRCPKCGYHSFDYLSACDKCRTDLTAIRRKLGFSGVRPTMPAWLENPPMEEPQNLFQPAADDDLPLLARGDGNSDRTTVSVDSPAERATLPSAAEADLMSPTPSEMTITLPDDLPEWSLLDLQPTERAEAAAVARPDLADAIGAGSAGDFAAGSGQAVEDQTVIELAEEDLKELLLELKSGAEEDDQA